MIIRWIKDLSLPIVSFGVKLQLDASHVGVAQGTAKSNVRKPSIGVVVGWEVSHHEGLAIDRVSVVGGARPARLESPEWNQHRSLVDPTSFLDASVLDGGVVVAT